MITSYRGGHGLAPALEPQPEKLPCVRLSCQSQNRRWLLILYKQMVILLVYFRTDCGGNQTGYQIRLRKPRHINIQSQLALQYHEGHLLNPILTSNSFIRDKVISTITNDSTKCPSIKRTQTAVFASPNVSVFTAIQLNREKQEQKEIDLCSNARIMTPANTTIQINHQRGRYFWTFFHLKQKDHSSQPICLPYLP